MAKFKTQIKKLLFIVLASLLISCNGTTKNKVDQTPQPSDEPTNTINKFKILNTSVYDATKLNYDGDIVFKHIWQDQNGENIVLFTKQERKLYAYHYAIDSEPKLLRKVYDYEEDCEFDLFLEFIEKSFTVTDLNNDNLGEVTFAYKKGCISDVSPLDLKLLILENGNKYIIRGSTQIIMGEESYGGNKEIDPSFDKAPDHFLSHANTVWQNIVKQ